MIGHGAANDAAADDDDLRMLGKAHTANLSPLLLKIGHKGSAV